MKKYAIFPELINHHDIAIFLRHLTTFITAGIPLAESLDFIANCQNKNKLVILISALRNDILIGNPLSSALSRFPSYFNPICCHLIQLGEHTGKLDTMLNTLSTYFEKNLALKKRIKQALFYPCIIISCALFITLSLLYFVVPHFAELFHDIHDQLPTLTICIFSLSRFLHQYFWYIVICFITNIALAIWQLQKLQIYSQMILQRLSRLPLFRDYLKQLALARFSRHLALTYSAGITIMQALPLAANAAHYTPLTRIMNPVIIKTRNGTPLSQSMAEIAFFPPLLLQFMKIGEESGKLDTMLDKYADIAEAHLDTLIQRANLLLEPLIMLCLGALIGGLVVGMYLPLFKLGSVL